jgi:hypothetical protein
MLRMILHSLKSLFTPEVTPGVTPGVTRLLQILHGEMTRKQIQSILNLKDEKHFREKYQQPAVSQGLIEMTIPEKPNSRLQKYKLTQKGIHYISDK